MISGALLQVATAVPELAVGTRCGILDRHQGCGRAARGTLAVQLDGDVCEMG